MTRNVSRIPKRGALGCEVSEYRPCIGVWGTPSIAGIAWDIAKATYRQMNTAGRRAPGWGQAPVLPVLLRIPGSVGMARRASDERRNRLSWVLAAPASGERYAQPAGDELCYIWMPKIKQVLGRAFCHGEIQSRRSNNENGHHPTNHGAGAREVSSGAV